MAVDITEFIVNRRADALLMGDYNKYRALLTRQAHTIKKRLGRTTPKGKKYSKKATISADDIVSDAGFVQLLLLHAERAWASAMHMRSVHSQDGSKKKMVGSARRHIISRLSKAMKSALQLVVGLQSGASSEASTVELLEARAYLASLGTAYWMEKLRWDQCLRQASLARVIYAALEKKYSREPIREFLSGTIDPSIRYSAYQLKLSRSISLSTIAKKYFPDDSRIKTEVETVDPDAFAETSADGVSMVSGEPQPSSQTITWRSRTVEIEDASISQALATAAAAESQLTGWMVEKDGQAASSKEKAAKYDDVIIASQDAVDATKTAIDELTSEGTDQGDKRMQSLQITRTAVNYNLVSWRVGRNRVLCGEMNGLVGTQEESRSRRINRLREQVVLYDAILQSLDSVKELPGVAADTSFVEELEAKHAYFKALRCLAIGMSHVLHENSKNALALFDKALSLVSPVLSTPLPEDTDLSGAPTRLDLSHPQVKTLQLQLQRLVWQYRGIVAIEKLVSEAKAADPGSLPPMISRLNEYRLEGVDLTRLVNYPPKLEPIPVKPLFLDLAWNYINYPSQKPSIPSTTPSAAEETETKKETKKGWFGFGR
ncbi:hypothetical protein FQN57_007436 [Myotisia sp. PD_48]|nr:hypothetical protein FQN57_007436 [Myotisia sp. PD_48]